MTRVMSGDRQQLLLVQQPGLNNWLRQGQNPSSVGQWWNVPLHQRMKNSWQTFLISS